jgi:mercuric ion binding protein
MKSLNIFLAIAMAFTSLTVNAQSKSSKTETVKVWGNCGMCQTRIEKAAKEVGATEAKWDSETNLLAVTYNPAKTSIEKIEKKMAAVGHDTKSFKADDAVYNKLHGCCKYERTAGTESASASCCSDKEKCAAMKDKACCKGMDEKHTACAADKSCCAKA